MRKSFILSLVMVVVLIASLATATFAWFTAQTTVETNTVTVTAASASDSIVVSAAPITANTQTNQSVTLTLPAVANEPMVLKSSDATAFQAYNLNSFTTLKTTLKSVGGNLVATSSGVEAQATLVSGVAGDNDSTSNTDGFIYLANVGASAHNYNIKVTINDGANSGLRVAVFRARDDGALDGTEFALVGIWAPTSENVKYAAAINNGAAYSEGTFAAEANLATYKYASGTAATTYYNAQTLQLTAFNASTNDVIAVRVYFEGDKVGNAQANATATFSIEFNLA